ncbi:MAG: YIP1 family protein [Anaerolineae bacterium]
MRDIIEICRGGLLLEDQAFFKLKASTDVFTRGLLIIAAVGLIVGLVTSAISFVQEVTGPPPEVAMQEARRGIEQGIRMAESFGAPIDPEIRELIKTYMDAGFKIAARVVRVAEATTPLPGPIGDLFEAVGRFVSYPFGWISTWMFYGLLVLLFAKLMGGRATIQQMLGTTSLVAVPHLLDLFGFIPCLGFLLGVVAFFWGLAIYVKGTAVANDFGLGKATLAVLLPVIIVFLLTVALIVAIIVMVAAGAQPLPSG